VCYICVTLTAPCVTFVSRSLLRVLLLCHAHCSVCYICVTLTAPCVTFVTRSLLRVLLLCYAHCSVCYFCVTLIAPCVTFVSRSLLRVLQMCHVLTALNIHCSISTSILPYMFWFQREPSTKSLILKMRAVVKWST
jgi:hypothetical protein